jgi:hypothetical protein
LSLDAFHANVTLVWSAALTRKLLGAVGAVVSPVAAATIDVAAEVAVPEPAVLEAVT